LKIFLQIKTRTADMEFDWDISQILSVPTNNELVKKYDQYQDKLDKVKTY